MIDPKSKKTKRFTYHRYHWHPERRSRRRSSIIVDQFVSIAPGSIGVLIVSMLFEPRVVLVKVEVGHARDIVKIGVHFAEKRFGLVEVVAFWLFFSATKQTAVNGIIRWLRLDEFDFRLLGRFDSVLLEIDVEVGLNAVFLHEKVIFERIRPLEHVVPKRIAPERFAFERILEQVIVLEATITGELGRRAFGFAQFVRMMIVQMRRER